LKALLKNFSGGPEENNEVSIRKDDLQAKILTWEKVGVLINEPCHSIPSVNWWSINIMDVIETRHCPMSIRAVVLNDLIRNLTCCLPAVKIYCYRLKNNINVYALCPYILLFTLTGVIFNVIRIL
jgi:hypothetical protein